MKQPRIAGTGHRPQKLGGFQDISNINRKLLNVARAMLEELQPRAVLSGMALGWDQALALAAIELQFPLKAVVAFNGMENAWPWESKQVYYQILEQAKVVTVVSPEGYHPSKLHIRNHYLVDNSDLMVALWNGDKSGGTASCIEYAKRQNKPIHNVWAKWEKEV